MYDEKFSVGGYSLIWGLRHVEDEKKNRFLNLDVGNDVGPNDDSLMWPFPAGVFHFQLLNQLEDKNHLSFDIETPTAEWDSKPTEQRFAGDESAWSHAQIDFCSDDTQYVVDDTIVIGCQLTFSKPWLISGL